MMTIKELDAVTAKVLRDLGLPDSPRVRGRSSAYHDYVALEFVFIGEPRDVTLIAGAYEALCRKHGWKVCRVVAHPLTGEHIRSVHVTLQADNVISTGDRRMPYGE